MTSSLFRNYANFKNWCKSQFVIDLMILNGNERFGPKLYEIYFFLFLWGLWRHQMKSSIYHYPLITYDVIEVGAPKTNMTWNCLIKMQILVFFSRESIQKEKSYDHVYYIWRHHYFRLLLCKNCSYFFTDFDNSEWNWKAMT